MESIETHRGNEATYTALLEPEADGRYSVHIPSLPGVHSYGDTRAEALRNVLEAAELWIEVEVEHGRSIPSNDPLAIIGEVSRIIATQRESGLDPQLELASLLVHAATSAAA